MCRGISFTDINLRDHVIHLNRGRFSRDGEFTTSAKDVDQIFQSALRARAREARAAGRKLPVFFYAHGGLVDESAGLAGARKQIGWWLANGVYPIFFVWETGFWNTIEHLLLRVRRRAALPARDVWDYTSDPLIEAMARQSGGSAIWESMKRSAELSSAIAPEGGARYAAQRLQDFCGAFGDTVELHAAGHSAGAIFHAHFLPAALALGVPRFKSLQLLAPAIRVDRFKQTLLPLIGQRSGIRRMTMFTMKAAAEKGDNCARLYHKSLLYLVANALEDRRGTPLLGLAESVKADADLEAVFAPGGPAEAVWSPTACATGRSACRATSHGGFDDDAAAMHSILRRVLGKSDTDTIVENPLFHIGKLAA